MAVPLVVELLNDRITNLITMQIGSHISQIFEMVELVESIVATGACTIKLFTAVIVAVS